MRNLENARRSRSKIRHATGVCSSGAISFISFRVLWLPRLCLQLTPGDGRPKNVAASRDRSVAWLSLNDAGMFPVPLNHPVAPLRRKTGTWQNE